MHLVVSAFAITVSCIVYLRVGWSQTSDRKDKGDMQVLLLPYVMTCTGYVGDVFYRRCVVLIVVVLANDLYVRCWPMISSTFSKRYLVYLVYSCSFEA